jgi:serine/threonine-protein kinase
VPEPVAFGYCDGGDRVYSLSGWLDGADAETLLPSLTESEQYAIGVKSGELLRKIHSMPVPEAEDSGIDFTETVLKWAGKYKARSELRSETGDMLVRYLTGRVGDLGSRRKTCLHGDFNTENIIVMPDGEVGATDFNSYGSAYGDPWGDLNNLTWMPTLFPPYSTGQLRGYFNGEPPAGFWLAHTYYLAYSALTALTDPYGLNGIEDGTETVSKILSWTDNFTKLVPSWYLEDI